MDWWPSRNIIWVYMINVQYIHYTIQRCLEVPILTAEKSRLQRLNPRPSWGTPGWAWGRGYPLCHCCGKCQVHRLDRGSTRVPVGWHVSKLRIANHRYFDGLYHHRFKRGGASQKISYMFQGVFLRGALKMQAYILKVFWKPSPQKRGQQPIIHSRGVPKKYKNASYITLWSRLKSGLKEVVILYPCLANLGDGLLLLY